MNEKVNLPSNLLCNICNKYYSSKSSLCNHNKKFHVFSGQLKSTNGQLTSTLNKDLSDLNKQKKYYCSKCNKEYNIKQSKWKHEKTCKKSEIIELKEEIKELKEMITNIGNSNNKQINKTTNNNNGTINNNNNNINIKVSLGNENIDDLSKKDQLKILNSGYMSLIKIIELLNLNPDLPQYNNILVTNLKDKFCKIYDEL
jgi:ABC-type antimicrobial peptide transport system permease subunit